MGRADSVYARLPVAGQHAAVSAYGLYRQWLGFGPGYAADVRAYAARERFTRPGWERWQRARLGELLRTAAERVPYYRDAWDADARRAAGAADLGGIPLLDKDAVRADPCAFLREDMRPWRPMVLHTSGSTGTPLANHWTVREWRNSRALREVRSAGWAGVSYARPRATFSGRFVEPDPQSRGPFHRVNAVQRQVYFSAFHLSAATAHLYVEALRRNRVEWLTGYAVSFYLLASFILDQGIPVPPLKAVVTTSEKVTPRMREVMERAYGCRVFEEYSSVENAVFASECERGRLHVSPDAGIVEILRPDGTPCEPGEAGEVVTTCLLRQYQPLIRYRLGDLAAADGEPCPCGRAMPVLREVVGRLEDVVVGPDGRQLVRFHGIFLDIPEVREGQVVQESLELIRVNVVAEPGFSAAHREAIERRVRERLGPVRVEVDVVGSIPRTAAGKFKAVVSRLRQRGAE